MNGATGPAGPRGITGRTQPEQWSNDELERLYRLKYGDRIQTVAEPAGPTMPPASAPVPQPAEPARPTEGVHAGGLDGHKIAAGTHVYCEHCVNFLLRLRSLAVPPDSN